MELVVYMHILNEYAILHDVILCPNSVCNNLFTEMFKAFLSESSHLLEPSYSNTCTEVVCNFLPTKKLGP